MSNLCKESFVMYRSHIDAINDVENDVERLAIYDAIFQFALDEKEVELSGISKTIFTLIKPQLQANNRKWANGKKGAASGSLGGRPKKPLENPKKTPRKPLENPLGVLSENPKETPNVNVNVNVNDNVINKSSKDNLLKKEKVKKKKSESSLEFPSWLNQNLWKDYLEMRKKIRKPATEYAQKLILKKLEGFEKENMGDGTLALEISIERAYQGVFEPRAEDRASKQSIEPVVSRPENVKESASQQLLLITNRCQGLRNEVGDDYIVDPIYRKIIKDYGGAFKFANLMRSDDESLKKDTCRSFINRYMEQKSQNETLGKKDIDLDKLSVNNYY